MRSCRPCGTLHFLCRRPRAAALGYQRAPLRGWNRHVREPNNRRIGAFEGEPGPACFAYVRTRSSFPRVRANALQQELKADG